MFDWKEIAAHLHKGTAVITFVKSDGTVRDMECTLQEYLLPETGNGSPKPATDNMVVFDLEKNAWRSFKKSKVIGVELIGQD